MTVRLLLRLALPLLILSGCAAAQPPASPSSSASASRAVAVVSPSQAVQPIASQPPARSSASASAVVATVPAARPAKPKELVIPAIGVAAPVEHVGTTAGGAMDVPREWTDVAWFEPGFRPGEKGGAVIAGHLDSSTGRAVFWDLHALKAGDTVLLKSEDGAQLNFQVVGTEIYPYDDAPLQRIFGPADVPMLNLITCNGTFDRGSKNYDKRLVVYARQTS